MGRRSSLAWVLGRAGMDVLIMDKADFPRNKVCAGWITPAIIDELQLDTATYARDNVFQPITGFVTGLIGDSDEVRAASPGGELRHTPLRVRSPPADAHRRAPAPG